MENAIGKIQVKTAIIPHGVDPLYSDICRNNSLKVQDELENSFSWLYVSFVKPYKHQWNVVRAASVLRERGLNVKLDLKNCLTRPR